MKRQETRIIEKVLYENLFGTNQSLAKEYGTTEVTIQRKGQKKELVDFMSYNIKKDIFRCYEIKVSMQDFWSKAAKSWYGNYNYLVVSKELYLQRSLDWWKEQIPKHVGIIWINPDGKYHYKEVVRRPVFLKLSQEEKDLLKNSLLRTLFYKSRNKQKD